MVSIQDPNEKQERSQLRCEGQYKTSKAILMLERSNTLQIQILQHSLATYRQAKASVVKAPEMCTRRDKINSLNFAASYLLGKLRA